MDSAHAEFGIRSSTTNLDLSGQLTRCDGFINTRHRQFILLGQDPFCNVTVRPIDLISTVYRTYQLVYRCAKKTK